MRPSPRHFAALFVLVAALRSLGCGASAPPPISSELPTLPEEEGTSAQDVFRSEVRGLLAGGQASEAESLLRQHLAQGVDPGEAGSLRVLLGEVLEEQGRLAQATVAFSTVAGRDGGDRAHPAALDGLARLRRKVGDERGAVRAMMRAWDLASEEERKRRTPRLMDAFRFLPRDQLGVLAHETLGFESRSLLLEQRGPGPTADDEVTIAVLAPFSGRFENFGDAFFLGVQIALSERDGSRVQGAPNVRLVQRDTAGEVVEASRQAQAAIFEDDCAAILGPLLSVTSVAAGAVAQAYEIPLLAPTATDPDLPNLGPMVITFDPSAGELVSPLADFSVNKLGNVRHAVLLANDGPNHELEAAFRESVEGFGGRVVVSIAYEPDERDFRHLIERIENANVDAVYIPGTATNIEALVPQLEFYEFRRRILGNGGWTHPRILDSGSTALEGGLFSVESLDYADSDFMQRMRRTVADEAGQEISRFHVRGYQAMAALVAAIDQGARLGEEIAETVRLRRFWERQPMGEEIHLVTYRDGALGPANWAQGFDLTPRTHPEAAESNSP